MTGWPPAEDERREAILHVARELFSRRPYAAVSVADVATAAGVSPPLVVSHFGSKQALYLEVIRSAVSSIREGLRAVPGPGSLNRLHASVRFYAAYAASHRAGFLSLLRGGHEATLPEAADLFESLRSEVAARMTADVSAGLPPLDDATRAAVNVAVRGHLGYVDAVVMHWLGLPDDERARVTPDTIARLTTGAFDGAFAALLEHVRQVQQADQDRGPHERHDE